MTARVISPTQVFQVARALDPILLTINPLNSQALSSPAPTFPLALFLNGGWMPHYTYSSGLQAGFYYPSWFPPYRLFSSWQNEEKRNSVCIDMGSLTCGINGHFPCHICRLNSALPFRWYVHQINWFGPHFYWWWCISLLHTRPPNHHFSRSWKEKTFPPKGCFANVWGCSTWQAKGRQVERLLLLWVHCFNIQKHRHHIQTLAHFRLTAFPVLQDQVLEEKNNYSANADFCSQALNWWCNPATNDLKWRKSMVKNMLKYGLTPGITCINNCQLYCELACSPVCHSFIPQLENLYSLHTAIDSPSGSKRLKQIPSTFLADCKAFNIFENDLYPLCLMELWHAGPRAFISFCWQTYPVVLFISARGICCQYLNFFWELPLMQFAPRQFISDFAFIFIIIFLRPPTFKSVEIKTGKWCGTFYLPKQLPLLLFIHPLFRAVLASQARSMVSLVLTHPDGVAIHTCPRHWENIKYILPF